MGSVDCFDCIDGVEGEFVGGDADYWAVFFVQGVDCRRPLTCEFDKQQPVAR